MQDGILSFVWSLILAFGASLTILIGHNAVGIFRENNRINRQDHQRHQNYQPGLIIRIIFSPSYIALAAIITSVAGWLFFIFAGEYAQIIQIGGLFWAIVVFALSVLFHGVFCLILTLLAFAEMLRTENNLRKAYSNEYRVRSEIAIAMERIFLR